MSEEDDIDQVARDLHKVIADYFQDKHGHMITTWLLFAKAMDGDGDRSVWVCPSEDLDLDQKMGIAAYLVENFRGQMNHERDDLD